MSTATMPARTVNPVPIFSALAIIVLLLAGVLLTAVHSSINDEVGGLISAQKVTFPAANNSQVQKLPPSQITAVAKYADQLVTNGPQANVFAADLMSAQMAAVGGGLSYAQYGSKLASAGHNQTVFLIDADLFREQAIQYDLENAYWFSQISQTMLLCAILAFAGAAVLLILSLIKLGRRVAAEAEALLRPVLES
jgi:hypothetical protein